MNIIDAAKLGKWVRRKAWKSWIVVRSGLLLEPMNRDDLLADDWIVHQDGRYDGVIQNEEREDESSSRFALLELD